MKVFLTGHTSGIGKSTHDLLKERGYQVFGFSRSNGYDIENIEEIVKELDEKDPDIFINNAYKPLAQTKLLTAVYDKWKNKDKIIINICSVAALIPPSHPDYDMSYASDKRAQREFCQKINFEYSKKDFLSSKLKLTNLNFDYVKTNFKSKHDKRKYPNLEPREVSEIILFVIDSDIGIREMSFHSCRPPEQTN